MSFVKTRKSHKQTSSGGSILFFLKQIEEQNKRITTKSKNKNKKLRGSFGRGDWRKRESQCVRSLSLFQPKNHPSTFCVFEGETKIEVYCKKRRFFFFFSVCLPSLLKKRFCKVGKLRLSIFLKTKNKFL